MVRLLWIIHLLFFVLVFSFSNVAYPQSVETDSLSGILRNLLPPGRSYRDDTTRIRTLYQLGRKTTDLNKAEVYFQKALDLSKKRNWKDGEYFSQYYLGKMYNKNGFYLKAIHVFYKTLFFAEQEHQLLRQANCLQTIGDAYLMLQQYSKSIDHYEKAIAIFKSQGKSNNYIDCLNNLSLVYYGQKKYDQALKLLYECQRNGASVKGTIYEASYLSNIASCYRDKKQLDSAIVYFDRALSVYRQNAGRYKEWLAITMVEKARVHDLLNQNSKAILLGTEAYKLNNKYYGNNLNVTLFLSDIFFKNGDYRKAYLYYKEYFAAWQNSQKQDRNKQIESLKFEYENKQKQIRIDLLHKDISQKALQRKFLIFGVVFLAFCLIASIWNFSILKKKNLKIEAQRGELGRIHKQLETVNSTLEQQVAYRTQELTQANTELIKKNKEIEEALYTGQNIERKRVASELHDNLGSTISGLIWQLDGMVMDTEAHTPQLHSTYSNLVDKMREAYTEIRYISHNLYPSELDRYGLQNSISRLIDSLNKNGKIRFTFKTSELALRFSKQIELELYAICMELLNNVIRHSNATQSSLELNMENDSIVLRVEDNGVGIDESVSTGGKGFFNIMNRLESIKGALSFSRGNDMYTTVTVTIPLPVKESELRDNGMV